METVLIKHTVKELAQAGYTGVVLVPMSDTLDDIPDGAIAAKLTWTKRAIRTAKQNSSLHKYLAMLCEALNDAGWDMGGVLGKISKSATIPWTEGAVKERLWRPVQISAFDVDSSTKLDTVEINVVYESLNNITASRLGVSIPWPSEYSQMYESIARKQ